GGPDLMIRTVERLSGCKFDYYTLTSFDGFERLVDQFGGISFVVDKRYFERGGSRIDLQPGRQVFKGKQALAWARNRKVGRPQGDFDRSRAQGDLLKAALTEARADYGKNPGLALRALGAMRRNLKMNIPLEESLKLGLLALRIDPAKVRTDVVDGENATEGGSSIVRITTAGKSELVDICSDGQLGS
ncbi:MAG TPA: LCP family protein, partial [Actinomycetota bacterium]|nr:LCP family protein [Actinomycetota bacterium]